jgi:hypothetical protein
MRAIPEIRKAIVKAMEAGQDITELEAELKEARLAEQTDKEVRELAEIASTRLQTKERADKVVLRADTQREAIKAFLQARNEVIAPLRKAIAKANVLPALQDKCYAEFHDSVYSGSVIKGLDGQLPADFTVPQLELANGTKDSFDVAKQALYYLQCASGLLSALHIIETKPQVKALPDPFDDEPVKVSKAITFTDEG